jgi:hypothetical protein
MLEVDDEDFRELFSGRRPVDVTMWGEDVERVGVGRRGSVDAVPSCGEYMYGE